MDVLKENLNAIAKDKTTNAWKALKDIFFFIHIKKNFYTMYLIVKLYRNAMGYFFFFFVS